MRDGNHNDERRKAAEVAAKECIRVLKEQFGVREAFVFGSLRGDSPWHERSDIDIAVEGLAPKDYWHALAILERLLPPGMGLDLITLESASPRLVVRAKEKVKMPQEPKERLRAHIEDEFASMERLVQAVNEFLASAPEQPSLLELAGLGKLVHDLYNGAERIFERIAVWLNEAMPSGDRWHIEFLEQMQREVPGCRPAVVDEALAARLLDYLKFCHLFRHTYELEWDRLRPLVEGMAETLSALREQVTRFLEALMPVEGEEA